MLQQLIVALVVMTAFGYASWTLMPAAWRLSLARRLGLKQPATSGCGSCGSCPSNAASKRPGTAPGGSVQEIQEMQVRFFPVRLASYKASSARSSSSSSASPGR